MFMNNIVQARALLTSLTPRCSACAYIFCCSCRRTGTEAASRAASELHAWLPHAISAACDAMTAYFACMARCQELPAPLSRSAFHLSGGARSHASSNQERAAANPGLSMDHSAAKHLRRTHSTLACALSDLTSQGVVSAKSSNPSAGSGSHAPWE
jgi:hypothetical protein